MKPFNKSTAGTLLFVFLMTAASAAASEVDVIGIDDPITPVVAEFIVKCIEDAELRRTECIVIEMDTPGGLDLAMRDIIKKIFASEVPVVVYVAPGGARAASAGALITIAAHVAAMAPGTNIGAAHPVNLGGGDMGKEMSDKIENDAAAYVESIALKRKRNPEWAVKAVRESVSISETEALKINVIDLVAPDLQALLDQLNGRTVDVPSGEIVLNTAGATVQRREMGMRENILKALVNPNIAYILFMIGLAGLYFELSNPGAVLPGVLGGISLILALYSMQTLSVNYAGVLLILLGTVLFVMEIKVVSYGLLTVGGIVSLTLGSLMLFDSPIPALRVSLSVVLPSVILISIFFVLLVFLVVRAQARRPATGTEGLVGMIGRAHGSIELDGKVFVHGEYWNAVSDQPVQDGSKIRVKQVDGMILKVENADQ